MFSHNIVADSKAKGLVDYIISKGHVTLPELMSLRINGERPASVSTYISDWRSYARKKGYEIVNSSIRGKRFNSLYYAQEIWKEKN